MTVATLLPDAEASDRSRKVLLAMSVVLIALNLRPVFSSLSVVLPEVMASTGLSATATAASTLTTLPVICLGVFAMVAPWLGRRFGTERTLLACLLMILVGTPLRGTGNVPLLFAATAGAAGGAGLTVPLEHALGGNWSGALAVWCAPAAVVALIWAPQALPRKPVASESAQAVRGLWRDPLACSRRQAASGSGRCCWASRKALRSRWR